ncbi:MAG: hypothetical protein AAFW70_31585, partial [Cyanobacteria bacterium J06635_10]
MRLLQLLILLEKLKTAISVKLGNKISTRQKLYFDALNNNRPNFTIRFIAPSGKEFYTGEVENDRDTETQQSFGNYLPGLILEEAGTYQIVIDGYENNFGDYSFRLLDLASATNIELDVD